MFGGRCVCVERGYVYVWVCRRTRVCVCVCVCVFVRARMHACACVCITMWVWVCMCVQICFIMIASRYEEEPSLHHQMRLFEGLVFMRVCRLRLWVFIMVTPGSGGRGGRGACATIIRRASACSWPPPHWRSGSCSKACSPPGRSCSGWKHTHTHWFRHSERVRTTKWYRPTRTVLNMASTSNAQDENRYTEVIINSV